MNRGRKTGEKGKDGRGRLFRGSGGDGHWRFGMTILLQWVVSLALFLAAPPLLFAEPPLTVNPSASNPGRTVMIVGQEF